MDKLIAELWVAALRSGEYPQTTHSLRDARGFCCLGVLCNLHAQAHPAIAATQLNPYAYMSEELGLPKKVQKWAGMHHPEGLLPESAINRLWSDLLQRDLTHDITKGDLKYLSSLNDGGYNFADIAKIIEDNVDSL